MAVELLTADEIVATLQRTGLPTILVEGPDDVDIFRWIESKLATSNADVLACGGRTNLLEVFRRRQEFAHARVTFVADRDMWVFSGVPVGYTDILFTSGYSIENDLYVSAPLESLLDDAERLRFRKTLALLIDWFAFEVEEYLAGRDAHVDCHVNRVVPVETDALSPTFLVARAYRRPSRATTDLVLAEYRHRLRGKLLFQLLARYLSASNRKSKFSIKNLHELGTKLANPQWIERFVAEIDSRLL